jgi:hypothetical protein
MKLHLTLICLLISATYLFGQKSEDKIYGSISFISSENVYVKFVSTKGINSGDTLYVEKDNSVQPAITITAISSMSCVGKPVKGYSPTLSGTVVAFLKPDLPIEIAIEKSNEPVSVNDLVISQKGKEKVKKPDIYGRLSVSSYNNFVTDPLSTTTPNFRLKYNLALNADRINDSRLSFENYMSYTHMLFDATEDFKDLKVYNLALKYDFKDSSSLTFGRKINVNTANIGAVDGLQYEKHFKNFTAGALIGFRPNDTTYSVDTKLFQYGAFISHKYENKFRTAQTSLAFFNQTNTLVTDRRYLYLQHSNSLLKNVDFFGSAEIDLYAIENNTPINDFDLTSLYLSLSYRPFRNLSLSLSFDERKNVYYFETYKNRIDSLLENEMRQGIRFRFNYRPVKNLTWGGTAGYRMQTPTSYESANAMSYLTYSRVPWIDVSFTISGTALITNNYNGFIYGASLSKDLNNKLSIDAEYRKAQIFAQDIAEIGILWRITDSVILSTNAEVTFEQYNTSGRLFFNISKRF